MKRVSVVLAVLVLVGLGPASASAKSLNWSASSDNLSMDPHSLNHTFNMAFLNNLYEGLVRHNPQLKIEPALAVSWTAQSPTVWRFKLRQGVKFHNGSDFDADDVVFSWQRANTAGSMIIIVINEIKDIRKVDRYTVDVDTKTPFPILLSVLTYFYMMDKEWCEKNDAREATDLKAKKENFANRNANGTGPFRLKSWDVDVRTVLDAHSGWWDKPQHNLTEVVFTPIKSDATRTSSLLSGAIDATVSIPLQDVSRVTADPRLAVIQGPELRTLYLGFDHARDELLYSSIKGKNPFKDIRVRRAFYQAIDVEAIKRSVMRGQAWPTGIILSPYLTGYPKGLNDRFPHDAEASRKLLAEADYPNGFSVGLSCPNDRYVYDEGICLAVVSMLAKVGVKVDPQIEPTAKWLQRLNGRDTSFFMVGHAGLPTADVFSTMYEVIATQEGKKGGGNFGRYSNPAFDALLSKIQQETNPATREALIGEAMQVEKADIGHIPLHQQPLVWAARKGIDLNQAPDNRIRLWHVTVQ